MSHIHVYTYRIYTHILMSICSHMWCCNAALFECTFKCMYVSVIVEATVQQVGVTSTAASGWLGSCSCLPLVSRNTGAKPEVCLWLQPAASCLLLPVRLPIVFPSWSSTQLTQLWIQLDCFPCMLLQSLDTLSCMWLLYFYPIVLLCLILSLLLLFALLLLLCLLCGIEFISISVSTEHLRCLRTHKYGWKINKWDCLSVEIYLNWGCKMLSVSKWC